MPKNFKMLDFDGTALTEGHIVVSRYQGIFTILKIIDRLPEDKLHVRVIAFDPPENTPSDIAIGDESSIATNCIWSAK